MPKLTRILCFVPLLALCFVVASCGGGGGSAGQGSGSANASASIKILGPLGSYLSVQRSAVPAGTDFRLVAGPTIPFPGGYAPAGQAIDARPDGLRFSRAGVIALPVSVGAVPNARTLDELRVFAHESDGRIFQVPVLGYDDEKLLVFAAIEGFTVFQAAVPGNTFAIVPRTGPLGFVGVPFSIPLTTANGSGSISWTLTSSVQMDGDLPEEGAEEPAANEIAPGVFLTNTGVVAGTPQAKGTWAFVVEALESAATARTASLSLTLSVAEREIRAVQDTPSVQQSILDVADDGTMYVLTRRNTNLELGRLDVGAAGQVVPSVTFAGGTSPAMDVSPDGESIVVVFEVLAGPSAQWPLQTLLNSIVEGSDGSVDNVSMDLTGDGVSDFTISFAVDATNGFTGSNAQLQAMADAINLELIALGVDSRAVVNSGFSGLAVYDNREDFVDPNSGFPNAAILPGGDVPFGSSATRSVGGNNGELQQIYAIEFDRQLNIIAGPMRVDGDLVYQGTMLVDGVQVDLDADVSVTTRRAQRPGVAFALDRGVEFDPLADPEPRFYCVAYESVRHLDAEGALRADVYAVWRQFGGATSSEVRVDATDSAGNSSGDPIIVAGTAEGATIVWTERGGDNDGGNPLDGSGNVIAGSAGDLCSASFGVPTVEDDDGLPATPDVVVIGEPDAPTFIHEEQATTTFGAALHVAPDNTIWIVFSERDDSPLTASALSSGRASQSSAALLRREQTLRAGTLAGGVVVAPFMVDDAPLSSTLRFPNIAVNDDGEIAITWVEDFGGGLLDGYLRRFSASDTPITGSLEISWEVQMNVEWLADGRLALIAGTGGDAAILRFVEPEATDEE